MTRIAKFTAIAAAVIAAPAFAAATIDANLELDNTYYNKAADQLTQGGRVEVNIGSKTTVGSGFVAAKGTLILGADRGDNPEKDGGARVDDMWVEGGTDAFSLKLGRFEAADLFPAGKDTLVVGGPGYTANAARGRLTGSNFHGALNANLGSGVGFELGLVETKTTLNETGFGYRPVVTFGAAGATFKLGYDKVNGTKGGFGATAGLKVAGGDVNVNYARKDGDNTGFGVNGTFGAFGAGFGTGKVAAVKTNTVYAAYSVPFFVPAATATFAVSTGKVASVRDTGLRARINYGF